MSATSTSWSRPSSGRARPRSSRTSTDRPQSATPRSGGQAETRRLAAEVFVLVLIAVPAVEVFVFIVVGQAIGWLLAVVLLLGSSVLGTRLARIQGRSAIEGVSLAVSEHRPPARAAIDGALGFLGGVLLAIPGFVTDVLGALL